MDFNWRLIFLEKLRVAQFLKKFEVFYRTQRFVTVSQWPITVSILSQLHRVLILLSYFFKMHHLYTFISVLNANLFIITLLFKNKDYELLHVSAVVGHPQRTVQTAKISTLYFQCN
jgi:hypothetical protein